MTEPHGGIANNSVYIGLNTAGNWINDLYDGRSNGMVLTGPAGIGKTHLADAIAARRGINIEKPRPGTARGLMQCLYECTLAEVDVIMIDDLDAIWADETALNTLKVALDSKEKRILSHWVKSEEHSIPEFEVTARVLFLSNKDFTDPSQFSRRIWDSGIEPLKSRCTVYGLPFDPLSLYTYTGWLASDGGMLKGLHFDLPLGNGIHQGNRRRVLSRNAANQVLEHFAANAYRYPSLSPRELVRLARARIGKSREDWEVQVEPLLTGQWRLPEMIPWFSMDIGSCGVRRNTTETRTHAKIRRTTTAALGSASRSGAASAASLRDIAERI